jgi:thioredoxin-related protein
LGRGFLFITMREKILTRRNFQIRLSATIAGLFSMDALSASLKEIPTTQSLQSEISAALKMASPLLVFVSLDNCPFCKIARDHYLLPLMNEQSIPIVQVNFRHLAAVTDSRGHVMTQDQLIRMWGVKVAPTLLFLGKDGKEIAPRLTGGSTSDFYGAYLDERMHLARTEIVRDQKGLK